MTMVIDSPCQECGHQECQGTCLDESSKPDVQMPPKEEPDYPPMPGWNFMSKGDESNELRNDMSAIHREITELDNQMRDLREDTTRRFRSAFPRIEHNEGGINDLNKDIGDGLDYYLDDLKHRIVELELRLDNDDLRDRVKKLEERLDYEDDLEDRLEKLEHRLDAESLDRCLEDMEERKNTKSK